MSIFALLLFAPVPGASAVGDLDQSVSGSTANSTVVSSTQAVGQVFTAGRSGLLDRISIDIRKEGNAGDLIVSIFEVSEGYPSGSALASQVVAASAVSTTMGAATIDFSSPATVIAGTQYAILLESPNSTFTYDMFTMQMMGGNYSWGAEVNPLASGFAVFRSNGSWTNSTGDLRFSTYVTAETGQSLPSSGAQDNDLSENQQQATLAATGYTLTPALLFVMVSVTLGLSAIGVRLKLRHS